MDTVDAATRSRIMSSIRSKGTRPERTVFAKLVRAGIRFRKWASDLPGSPDAHVRGGCVVFVHGCFWHGHAGCYRAPRSNRAFWRRKVEGNMARDRSAMRRVKAAGLVPVVVWECEAAAWSPREALAWR